MQTANINVQPDLPLDKDSQSLKPVDSLLLDGEATQTGEAGIEADGITTAPEAPFIIDMTPLEASVAQTVAEEPAQANVASPPVLVVGSAPPPAMKRFSSANISKKFMQKATSASGNQVTHGSTGNLHSVKPTAAQLANGRPNPPNGVAYPSRLVTAKLTNAVPSSASSTGWSASRPGSASSTANPSPAQTPGAAQMARRDVTAMQNGTASNDRGRSTVGKPWGDLKKPQSGVVAGASSDFPTAAEVANTRAQIRSTKPALGLSVAEPEPVKVVPTDSSADAFRGVHLDPNVHQWYEDDNDDNDFLGDVVQFGDGTQYSVPPTAASEYPPDLAPSGQVPLATISVNANEARSTTKTIPKQDRFHDDFDRSWPRGPRSRKEPSLVGSSPKPPVREVTSPAPSHASTLHSDRDRDRALFNEKSNRLEPYSASDRGSFFQSRDGDSNRPSGFRSTRDQTRFSTNDRDREMHHSVGPRTPNFGGRGSGRPPWAERVPSGQFRTGAHMGLPGAQPSNNVPAWNRGENRRSSISSRDEGYSQNATGNVRPTASSGGWNRQPSDRSTGSFNAPADQIQGVSSHRNDAIQRSPIPNQRSSLSSAFRPDQAKGGPLPSDPDAVSTPQTVTSPSVPQLGLEEVTKIAMHSAAERAKIRRQEEEASREQQRERARAKAAAIEALQLAQEEEKRQQELTQKEAERHEREAAEKIVTDRKRKEEEVMKRLQEEERAMRNRERQAAEAREQERERLKRPVIVPPEVKPAPATRPKLQLLPRTIPVPPVVPVPDPMERWQDKSVDSVQSSNSKVIVQHASQAVIPGTPAEAVSYLDNHSGGDIQTIDFSDMASLMGVVEGLQIDATKRAADQFRRRLISSDFFDDDRTSLPVNITAAKTTEPNAKTLDAPSWRSNNPSATPASPVRHQTTQEQSEDILADQTLPTSQKTLNVTVISPTLSASSRATTSPTAQRSVFKQAPLSSLADTISRFKGALATMQTVPEAAEGLESASHVNRGARKFAPRDFAASKVLDTAISALYAMDEEPTVLLAKRIYHVLASDAQEKLTKFKPKRKSIQLKIMSYEPPIGNISPRTLSRDDILLNGKNVYNVHFRLPNGAAGRPLDLSFDRAHLDHLASKRGAFGRGSGAEEADWRRRPVTETGAPSQNQHRTLSQSVNTMENQPSKQLQSSEVTVIVDDLARVHRDDEPSSPSRKGKNKADPRGDVGFYRTSQLPETFTAFPVSFMVVSEIEGSSPTVSPEIETSSQPIGVARPSETTVSHVHLFPSSRLTAFEPSSQSESSLLTPPATHSAVSWTTSPAGFPIRSSRSDTDPDHIKAVWEHGPSDSSTHANSLKDITDEYPAAILLSVQEIKSDDGEPKLDGDATASSSLAAPIHRKSLQDAHRAFQMVPTPQQSFTAYQNLPSAHTGESYPSPMPDLYGQQGFQTSMLYGARPFQTPPVPNMMWASQSPYVPPLNLAPHGIGPASLAGQSPPMPHHGWTQQQPPSPYPQYNGSLATYSYMTPPPSMNPGAFKVTANTMNVNPAFGGPSAMHTGVARRYPPTHHGQHPPPSPHHGAPIQYNGSQVMSPNMYGSSLPSAGQSYGPLTPAGRGGSRTTFELPPPATPQLYPQMGNAFHPQRW